NRDDNAIYLGLVRLANMRAEHLVAGGLDARAHVANHLPDMGRVEPIAPDDDIEIVHIVREPEPLGGVQRDISKYERAAEPRRDGGEVVGQARQRHLELATAPRLDQQWLTEAGTHTI